MTHEAGGEVAELVVSWIVTTALTFTVVIVDERKILDERQLERAWPPVSRDAAIVAFGILALPVHFVRTRFHLASLRGVLGLPLGLVLGAVAIAFVAVVGSVVLTAAGWLLGLPSD